ncbi:MAG TPA: hypothetical protein PKA82_09495 [Pyrinomonadaceae bacterium]|nr:hypothetical protein [Pyrinomonadaceae bacterium]
MTRNVISVLLVAVMVVALGLGCGASGENAAKPYVGDWKAADGTTWTIRLDATCDYKSAKRSVTNAPMTWDPSQGTAIIDFGDGKDEWKKISVDESRTTLTFGETTFKKVGTN